MYKDSRGIIGTKAEKINYFFYIYRPVFNKPALIISFVVEMAYTVNLP